MKLKITLIITALSMIFSSCEKSTTDPGNFVPVLEVNPASLSFSIDNAEAFLIITNAGDGELAWDIIGKPDWLAVSTLSGQTTNDADTVRLTANTDLDVGDYSGAISIDSNGGSTTVDVTISIEHKSGILLGVGAAKMSLGDTYSDLMQIHGDPDSRMVWEIYYPNDGHYEYWHNLYYYSIKAIFVIFSYSSSVGNNDTLISISVEYPYDGLTEELIGIGSSLSNVVAAYDEPPEIVTGYLNYYKYESLGANFYYDEGDTLVIKIKVYYPK